MSFSFLLDWNSLTKEWIPPPFFRTALWNYFSFGLKTNGKSIWKDLWYRTKNFGSNQFKERKKNYDRVCLRFVLNPYSPFYLSKWLSRLGGSSKRILSHSRRSWTVIRESRWQVTTQLSPPCLLYVTLPFTYWIEFLLLLSYRYGQFSFLKSSESVQLGKNVLPGTKAKCVRGGVGLKRRGRAYAILDFESKVRLFYSGKRAQFEIPSPLDDYTLSFVILPR